MTQKKFDDEQFYQLSGADLNEIWAVAQRLKIEEEYEEYEEWAQTIEVALRDASPVFEELEDG